MLSSLIIRHAENGNEAFVEIRLVDDEDTPVSLLSVWEIDDIFGLLGKMNTASSFFLYVLLVTSMREEN